MLSSLQPPGLDLRQTPRKNQLWVWPHLSPPPHNHQPLLAVGLEVWSNLLATPLTASQLGEYGQAAHATPVAAAKLRFKIRGGGWGVPISLDPALATPITVFNRLRLESLGVEPTKPSALSFFIQLHQP